jgi:hypothetical protein
MNKPRYEDMNRYDWETRVSKICAMGKEIGISVSSVFFGNIPETYDPYDPENIYSLYQEDKCYPSEELLRGNFYEVERYIEVCHKLRAFL